MIFSGAEKFLKWTNSLLSDQKLRWIYLRTKGILNKPFFCYRKSGKPNGAGFNQSGMASVLNLAHACCTKPIKTWAEQTSRKVKSCLCLLHNKWIFKKQRSKKTPKEYILYVSYKFIKKMDSVTYFYLWRLTSINRKPNNIQKISKTFITK